MVRLFRKREIIDARALARALVDAEGGASQLAAFKAAFSKGRVVVHQRLEAGERGASVVAANSYLIDRLLVCLLDLAARESGLGTASVSVIAVGGYGRAELAPYSDIDLLFLFEAGPNTAGEQFVEFTLHRLWDLGLSVGHAARTLDDCLARARADMTIRTSLLEARPLWGADDLFATLRERFFADIVAGSESAFIAAKLDERGARHRKTGDSRYVLEPNVKEGKGGLRDLHTLYWIGKYLYRVEWFRDLVGRGVLTSAEYRRFAKAEEFFWRVRAHLHVLAGARKRG